MDQFKEEFGDCSAITLLCIVIMHFMYNYVNHIPFNLIFNTSFINKIVYNYSLL